MPRGDGNGLETVQGLPLSGEAVRRFLAAMGAAAPEEHERLVCGLVRLAFPLSWRRLWWRDVARRVSRSPLRHVYLASLLTIPPEPTGPAKEPDEWDRLRAMQQDPVPPPGARVPFDRVCRITEATMGPGWYWNPARWDTADGYAPYDVVWRAWETLQMTRALERLNVIRAIGVTKAGDKAQGLFDADVREALGG